MQIDVSRLDFEEIRLIKACLRAAVSGRFFDEPEFDTLFGLSMKTVSVVAKQWPNFQDADVAERAIMNALNNIAGFPISHASELPSFGISDRASVRRLHEKLSEPNAQ